MADDNSTPAPRPLTRAERLAKQRDDFLLWAKTATTDEIPGILPDSSKHNAEAPPT